jgi:hypothetical protein
VAVLLVFTIVTIEVQMVANDVYPGVRRRGSFPSLPPDNALTREFPPSAGGNAYAVFSIPPPPFFFFPRASYMLTSSPLTAVDFPGALTLFLAIPTVWAVLKALKRIQEGRRPTPNERADQTFWELAREKEQRRRLRQRRRMRRAERGGGEWS